MNIDHSLPSLVFSRILSIDHSQILIDFFSLILICCASAMGMEGPYLVFSIFLRCISLFRECSLSKFDLIVSQKYCYDGGGWRTIIKISMLFMIIFSSKLKVEPEFCGTKPFLDSIRLKLGAQWADLNS